MSAAVPLYRIPVGIVVERQKAASRWIDFVWRPVAALAGVPDAAPGTMLGTEGDATRFYAGSAEIELYRTETAYYRDNLASGAPALWVALQEAHGTPPYSVAVVTADPGEGEALAQTSAHQVEAVPMPSAIQDVIARFVAAHHVEREFVKRQRDRADPEALARGARGREREEE